MLHDKKNNLNELHHVYLINDIMTYTYIIGSGWFSDEKGISSLGKQTLTHQQRYGGSAARSTQFSQHWLLSILQMDVLPKKIIICDADSVDPLHDSVLSHPLVSINPQTQNFGHGSICEAQNILCGWARGVLMNAMYTYINSVDYYVYVEQDVLLMGNICISKAIEHMNIVQKPICFGSGDETPQKLQQSFFIVKHSFLPHFISRLISWPDNRITEENKYFQCFQQDMTFLPFRGGRQRQHLNPQMYYKQHMDFQEMQNEIIELQKQIQIKEYDRK